MRNNWKRSIVCLILLVTMLICLPTNVAEATTYQKWSKNETKCLQDNLTFLGFDTKGADGLFGNNTKKAVIAIQKALHMEETGSVDDALYTLLKNTVYDVQLYLKQKGYYTDSVDGIIGPNIKKALKSYKKARGYDQTETVNYFLLKEMLNDSTAKQYLGALEEYIARMEGTYVEKVHDDAYWEAYEAYVQQKMDDWLERLGVKEGTTVYFTRNQKTCHTKHRRNHPNKLDLCNNCSVTYIMEDRDGWFQKEFGVVDTDNLPNHTIKNGVRGEKGQTCFGFANATVWFIFSSQDSPDVRTELVVEPKLFTKEYIQKNAQPGDILRLENTHSVVLYAVGEAGVEVVDCNYPVDNNGNPVSQSLIQKRFISYSGHYKNKTVSIDRVKYFDESLLNTTEVYTTTDASVLNDERYQVIKTEESTEYGYREKETCMDMVSEKEGWILAGETLEDSVLVDWTEQVLTAGDNEKVITRQTEKEIETTVYQYSNYYWYTTTGATNLSSRSWAEKYGRTYNKTVTKAWDYSGLTKSNYKYNVLYSKEYDTPLEVITAPGGKPYVDETGFQWWQEDKNTVATTVTVTEYKKLVNVSSYQFYRWTEEKGWRTDCPYVETDTCKPVTRKITTYYYINKIEQ